jgi:hypothetical protein
MPIDRGALPPETDFCQIKFQLEQVIVPDRLEEDKRRQIHPSVARYAIGHLARKKLIPPAILPPATKRKPGGLAPPGRKLNERWIEPPPYIRWVESSSLLSGQLGQSGPGDSTASLAGPVVPKVPFLEP